MSAEVYAALRSRWNVLVALSLLASTSGCAPWSLATSPPVPPLVRAWNVLGVVSAAEFGDSFDAVAIEHGPGQYQPRMRMGPMSLTLIDEREFVVPPDTLGDNNCRELRPHLAGPDVDPARVPGDFSSKCVILGAAANGVLEWFIVLDFEPDRGVRVGHPFRHDDGLLTGSGFVFGISEELTVDCFETDTLDGVLDRDGSASTYVDPSSAQVVSISCLYSD